MPELPEVEITRQGVAQRISGAFIQSVQVGKVLRWPLGCTTSRLVGCQVLAVGRRGKYLLMTLDSGLLIWHLGMSGSLRWVGPVVAPGPHDHFDLHTSAGVLRLHDPRRFGAVVFVESEADPLAVKLLGKLGLEPLDEQFDADVFHRALSQRRSAIKPLLLSGSVVVGVGNIYASEALFLAGIRPTTLAAKLSKVRAARLHMAIKKVLNQAIRRGGSSLKDFAHVDGSSGAFQDDAMVYGREGLACKVCGAVVRRIQQGQRSSYFCPVCQKP